MSLDVAVMNVLSKLYYNPESPSSFSGIKSLYDQARANKIYVTRKQVK